MRNETRLVRLWQMDQSDKAFKFSVLPPVDSKTGGVLDPNGQIVWIPRSLIEHISRDPKLPCGWTPCNVTLAAWKAEELGL